MFSFPEPALFNFAIRREPEQYRMIVEWKGAVPPPKP